MNPESQVLALLRDQIAEIVFGTIFLFIGLSACTIAVIRRESGARIFAWLGAWSAMYGSMRLTQSTPVLLALPTSLRAGAPYLNTAATYLVLVTGALAFAELSLGAMRWFARVCAMIALAIALGGIAFFVFTGSNDKLIPLNNLLAACLLLVLIVVVAIPRLSRKYLVLSDRGVLAVGIVVFCVEAMYANLSRSSGHRVSVMKFDHLGFAILLFCFGYAAVQISLSNEKRLMSIENELQIARQLQLSILPNTIPRLQNVGIVATYEPMTAVAGDFYEFLPVDQHRAGFFVADVSGHGVPAALIASMIKMAVQSVKEWASDPAEVLRQLGNVLDGQLQGQFVTAAYLWIDSETGKGRYSAAGHPPLLCWRQRRRFDPDRE